MVGFLQTTLGILHANLMAPVVPERNRRALPDKGNIKMPTITIDGKEITVEKGKTIIQAADQAGIDIPRYCYHEGLPIVGQCRICLVEVEKAPKLQVACYCPVNDGMVVHTKNEKVKKARQEVLEFLLINHPIDCPVCDQAGECFLQEYYMKHGLYDSKMLEDKNKKNKAVDVGPHIVLDSERCILCTRCVRFCDTVTKTHELGIFNRGDHAELRPMDGKTLDNPYAANVVDICPVGALTEKDFRFKTRVWYLDETESICTGCSTGCNISIHTNKKRTYKNDERRIARLKPRYNGEVNQHWMCDVGRYGFQHVDADSRIAQPELTPGGEATQQVSWQAAIDKTAGILLECINQKKSVGIIASPQMTNESLFVTRKFASESLDCTVFPISVRPREKQFSDDFLIREDKNPNSKGAELLGFDVDHKVTDSFLDSCAHSKIDTLIVFEHDLANGYEQEFVEKALGKVKNIIFIGSNRNATSALASVVLPAATWAEMDGTFTNHAGLVQHAKKALEPLGESRPTWMIVRNIARKLEVAMPYFETSDVFDDMARKCAEFEGLSFEQLAGSTGAGTNGVMKSESTLAE